MSRLFGFPPLFARLSRLSREAAMPSSRAAPPRRRAKRERAASFTPQPQAVGSFDSRQLPQPKKTQGGCVGGLVFVWLRRAGHRREGKFFFARAITESHACAFLSHFFLLCSVFFTASAKDSPTKKTTSSICKVSPKYGCRRAAHMKQQKKSCIIRSYPDM